MYTEKIIPKITPKIVALQPIINPTKKKIFLIDLFLTPIDFKIAISLVLFFTKIVNPEIILNAATIIVSDKIMTLRFSQLLMLRKEVYSYLTRYKLIHLEID